jgi:hypothetical protein
MGWVTMEMQHLEVCRVARNTPDQSSSLRPLSVALGLIAGAALGLLLIAPTIFDGDVALGTLVGAGLGLLIGAVIDVVAPRS